MPRDSRRIQTGNSKAGRYRRLKARDARGDVVDNVGNTFGFQMATTVHYIPDADWFLGGRSLAMLGGSAFHLDISITDETNTKGEKARFLREVQAAMATLRPDLHDLCYVHLIDARAAAYGYGGRT